MNESNIIIPGQHDPKYNKDVEAARQAAMEHDPPKPVAAMLMDNGSMIVLSQYGQQMPVLQCNLFELWGHIVEAAGYGKDVDVAVTCKQEKVRKITGVGQDFKIEMDAVDSLSNLDAEKVFSWHFIERAPYRFIASRGLNELDLDPEALIPSWNEGVVEHEAMDNAGKLLVCGALMVRGQEQVIAHLDYAFYYIGHCMACGFTHPYISFGCDMLQQCRNCGYEAVVAPPVSSSRLAKIEEESI